MASPSELTVSQLLRLVGTPVAPAIIDVRVDEDFNLDPRMLPAGQRRSHTDVAQWAAELTGRRVVVICQKGLKLSQGVAAWLRAKGVEADSLEGGFVAWAAMNAPLVTLSSLPALARRQPSVWVTRARPKIDRVACPWLIRRFLDPDAIFLFVSPSEVLAVAERFNATPFDVEDVLFSHRGETCSFDTMLAEFGLDTPALRHVARIVRGADTAALDIEPQAAGLLAISVGLSRLYRDDLEQVDAAMVVYDALYRWCRDATEETHNWLTVQKERKPA